MKNLMKSGEFASQCGTTKETLRHYNEIRILQPVHIAENGYNLYNPLQAVDFLIIDTLKTAGFTLEEIHQYTQTNDIRELDNLFYTKHREVLNHLRKLQTHSVLLDNMIRNINGAKAYFGTPKEDSYIVHLNASSYIETELPVKPNDLMQVVEPVTAHTKLCRELGLERGTELMTTYRLSVDWTKQEIRKLFLCTCCDSYTDKQDGLEITRRKAGEYLEVVYALSDKDSQDGELTQLHLAPSYIAKHAQKRGYNPSGDIFIIEMGRYIEAGNSGLLVRLQVLCR